MRGGVTRAQARWGAALLAALTMLVPTADAYTCVFVIGDPVYCPLKSPGTPLVVSALAGQPSTCTYSLAFAAAPGTTAFTSVHESDIFLHGCSPARAGAATSRAGKAGYSACIAMNSTTTALVPVPSMTFGVRGGAGIVVGFCFQVVSAPQTSGISIAVNRLSSTGLVVSEVCRPFVMSPDDCAFVSTCVLRVPSGGFTNFSAVLSATSLATVTNIVAAVAACPGDGTCGGHGICIFTRSDTLGAVAACSCMPSWTGLTCQTSARACAGAVSLNGTSGYFESNPNDGSQYSALASCSWTVTVPSFMAVMLVFTRFQTEAQWDAVNIVDGAVYSPYSGSFTAATLEYTAGGNSVTVTFTSNAQKQFTGFGVRFVGAGVACNPNGPPAGLVAQFTSSAAPGMVNLCSPVTFVSGGPIFIDVGPVIFLSATTRTWISVCTASYVAAAMFRARLFEAPGSVYSLPDGRSRPGGNVTGLNSAECATAVDVSFRGGVCSVVCEMYVTADVTVYATLERQLDALLPFSVDATLVVRQCPSATIGTQVVECGGQGTCTVVSGTPTCACNSGFDGAACDLVARYCAASTSVTVNNGTISDGAASQGIGTQYRENTDCEWTFGVPSGFAIDMQFIKLSTELNYDFVTISGLPTPGSTTQSLLGVFSGMTVGAIPRCWGECVVSFKADRSVQFEGFSITFSAVLAACDASSAPVLAISHAPMVFGPSCTYSPSGPASTPLIVRVPELAGPALAGRRVLLGVCVRSAGSFETVVAAVVANDTATIQAYVGGDVRAAVWYLRYEAAVWLSNYDTTCEDDALTVSVVVDSPPPGGYVMILRPDAGKPLVATFAVAFVVDAGACVHGEPGLSNGLSFVCRCSLGYSGISCAIALPSCNGTTRIQLQSSPSQVTIDDGGSANALYAPLTRCGWVVDAANAGSRVVISLVALSLNSTFGSYDSVSLYEPPGRSGALLASLINSVSSVWYFVSPGPSVVIDFDGSRGGSTGFALLASSMDAALLVTEVPLYFTQTPAHMSNSTTAVFQVSCPLSGAVCCVTWILLGGAQPSVSSSSTSVCSTTPTLTFNVTSGNSYQLDVNAFFPSVAGAYNPNTLTYSWSVYVGSPNISSFVAPFGILANPSPQVSLMCSEGLLCCYVGTFVLSNSSSLVTLSRTWCDGLFLPPLPLGIAVNVTASAYPRDFAGSVGPRVQLGTWEYDSRVPVASFVGKMPSNYNMNLRVFKLSCLPEVHPCTYEYSTDGTKYTPLSADGVATSGGDAVDMTAIQTLLVQSPPLFGLIGDAQFTFGSANKAASKFSYAVDGGEDVSLFAPATAVIFKASNLAIGSHTLVVAAADAEGNVDPSPVVYTWTVVASGPVVIVASGPVNRTGSRIGVFELAVESSFVEYYEYCVDVQAACSRTSYSLVLVRLNHTVGVLRHEFYVRGVDFAGTAGPWTNYTWFIDERNIAIYFAAVPANGTLSSDASFVVVDVIPNTNDKSPVCFQGSELSVDGGAWVLFDVGVIVLPPLAAGTHAVSARVLTCAGVISYPISAEFLVVSAIVPPVVTIVMSPARNDTSTTAVFEVHPATPIDQITQLQYCVDEGLLRSPLDWTPCSPFLSLVGLARGTHHIAFRAMRRGVESPVVTSYDWTIAAGFGSDSFGVDVPTDGTAVVFVRASDAALNAQVTPTVFSWTLDTVAPVSSVVLQSPTTVNSLQVLVQFFASEPATITYFVTGPGGVSGVVASVIPCSTTVGSPCAAMAVSFTGGNGAYSLTYFAADQAGNAEIQRVKQDLWTLDTVAPVVSISNEVPADHGLATSNAVSATLQCSKTMCAFEYLTQAAGVTLADWRPTGPQWVAINLADAQYAFLFRATDSVGNVASAPYTTYAPVVDVSPPVARLVSGPASGAYLANDTVTLVFACNKLAECTFLTTVASLTGTLTSGSTVVLTLQNGVQQVSVRAVSPQASQSLESALTISFMVDTVPPQVRFGSRPPSFCGPRSANSAFNVDVSAASLGDAVAFNLVASTVDGSSPAVSWTAVSSSSSVGIRSSLITSTNYSIQLWGIDRAGNVQLVPDQVFFYFTADVPVVAVSPSFLQTMFTNATVRTASFAVIDAAPVTIALSAGAGVTLSVSMLTSPFVFTVRTTTAPILDGSYFFYYRATDAAGNQQSTLTQVTWTLDRRLPAVTLVRAPPLGPTAATAVLTAACADSNGCTSRYVLSVLDVPVSGCADKGALVALTTFTDVSGEARTPGVWYPLLSVGRFQITPSLDGRFRVLVIPSDAAGNVGKNASIEWVRDTSTPAAPSFLAKPNPVDRSSSRNFTVEPGNSLGEDDSVGGVVYQYMMDGALPWIPATSTPVNGHIKFAFHVAPLAEGPRRIDVRIVDASGNTGPTASYSWVVESSPPLTVLTLRPAPVIGTSIAYFLVQSVSRSTSNLLPHSQFQISVNGGEFAAALCKNNNTFAYVEREILERSAVFAAGNYTTPTGMCVIGLTLPVRGSYTVSIRAVTASSVSDDTPETVFFQYEYCADTQYSAIDAVSGELRCTACVVGAHCALPTTTFSTMPALPGYWSVPGSASFYECRLTKACLGGTPGTTVRSACNVGYSGVLCDVCAPGYYLALSSCAACPASVQQAWEYVGAMLCGLVVAVLFVYKWQKLLPKQYIKMLLGFGQVISSANSAYQLPWPHFVEGWLDGAKLSMLDLYKLTKLDCAQPTNFFVQFVVSMVLFKGVLILAFLVVLWWVHSRMAHVFRKNLQLLEPNEEDHQNEEMWGLAVSYAHTQAAKRGRTYSRTQCAQLLLASHYDETRSVAIALLILLCIFSYTPVSVRTVQMFVCETIEGVPYLSADMRLTCTGSYFAYAAYAALIAVFFVVGLPAFLAVYLFRNRRAILKGERWMLNSWGTVYDEYGTHAYLWEVEELIRKLLLSSLVVVFDKRSPVQVAVAVFICCVAHVLHATWKPYMDPAVYRLQHGFLFATFSTFFLGLCFKVNAFVGRAATATDVFAYLLIAFVVCLVLTTLVFAGKSMKLRWEKRLPPAPLPASAGVMRRCLELLAPVRVPRASALFASSKRASFVVRRKVGAEGGSLPLAMNPIARSEIIEAMRGADDGEAAWAPGVTTPRGRAASDELPAGWTVVEDDDGERYYVNEATGASQWDRPTAPSGEPGGGAAEPAPVAGDA